MFVCLTVSKLCFMDVVILVYFRLRLGSPPKSQDAINLGFDSCLMYNVENWTEIYMVS